MAARRGPFDGSVAKGSVELWQAGLRKAEDVFGQLTGTRGCLHQLKFGGTTELLPHFRELARKQAGEDRMYVDARIVVVKTP